MRVKYLQIQLDHMRLFTMKRSPAFLLIEVLVAMVVFVAMVSCVGGLISVWLTTEADQRARHTVLAQVYNALEKAKGTFSDPRGEARNGRSEVSILVQPVDVRHVWVQMPTWVGQLRASERPAVYRAIVARQIRGRAVGSKIAIEVTG